MIFHMPVIHSGSTELPIYIHRHNLFGKSLVQMCSLLNVHLSNGRIYGDQKEGFTCIANEGASIVNYNSVPSELFENVLLFYIEDRDKSVHFALKCVICLRNQTEEPIQNTELADHECQSQIQYSWVESRSTIYNEIPRIS